MPRIDTRDVIGGLAMTAVVAQWQHETHAKNRFRGDKAWLKLIMPL